MSVSEILKKYGVTAEPSKPQADIGAILKKYEITPEMVSEFSKPREVKQYSYSPEGELKEETFGVMGHSKRGDTYVKSRRELAGETGSFPFRKADEARAPAAAQTAAQEIQTQKKAAQERVRQAKTQWEIEKDRTMGQPDQQEALAPYEQTVKKAMDEVTALEDRATALATENYFRRNKEQEEKLSTDTAGQTAYRGINTLREDLQKVTNVMSGFDGSAQAQRDRAYLAGKYGMTERELEGKAEELARSLSARIEEEKAALKARGYDYDAMEEYRQRGADQERYEKRKKGSEEFADRSAGLASALTVGLAPARGIDYINTLVQGAGRSDPADLETYVPANPYRMDITNRVGEIRERVAENLKEDVEKDFSSEALGKLAAYAYQIGMSLADSALGAKVFRAGTIYQMGAGAAAEQAKEIMERGGNNHQVMVGGLAAGIAEAFFEKFSIENLLTPHNVTSVRRWVTETLKQAGTEASEEIATEIANIITDTAIMTDKSEFALKVEEYVRNGMSRREAEQKVYLEKLGQVGMAGLGGAISGGIMGGVANAWQGAAIKSYQRGVDTGLGSEYSRAGEETVRGLIDQGMKSAPGTEANRLAQELGRKYFSGQTLTDAEIGAMVRANEAAIQSEEESQTIGKVEKTAPEGKEKTAPEGTVISGDAARGAGSPAASWSDPEEHPLGKDATRATEDIVTETEEESKGNLDFLLRNQGRDYAAKYGQEAYVQAINEAWEKGEVRMNAEGEYYRQDPETHIDRRDMGSVGSRRVEAFQYQHPELHDYFVKAAKVLKSDLEQTTRGERWAKKQIDPVTGREDIVGVTGVKRHTTPEIARLLDDEKFTYEEIGRAIQAIIDDRGQENYAAAKRVELVLDDMLTNGYTDIEGYHVLRDLEYIKAKQEIPGAVEQGEEIDWEAEGGLPDAELDQMEKGVRQDEEERPHLDWAGSQTGETRGTGDAQGHEGGQVSLSDADAGRRGDERPGERTARVPAEVRQAGGTKQNRRLIEQRQQAVYDEEITSPADEGVPYGSEEMTCKVLPEHAWDEEIRQAAEWAYGKGIKTVRVLMGSIGLARDGSTVEALGAIDTTKGVIYVRGDSLQQSFSETVEHEVGHWLTDQEMVRQFRDTIQTRYKEAAWGALYDAYRAKYAGVTDDFAGMTAEEIELYVWEEIMEDAYANMNKFGTRASVYGREAESIIEGHQSAQEAREEPDGQHLTLGAAWATEDTRGPPDVRYNISENLKGDLQRVLDGSFFSQKGEVYVGESSNFLTETIGARPLTVTMPANKAYASMVSEGRAKAEGRWDSNLNYHDLGVTGLLRVLESSENPVAAFAASPENGEKRSDRIVLVTDEIIRGFPAVVIAQVDTTGVVNGKRAEVNKTITAYDRAQAVRDILEAYRDGRLLYLDKKRSQTLDAGVPGSNSPAAMRRPAGGPGTESLATIRVSDFKKNIQDFWSGVNWKKSGLDSYAAEGESDGKTEMRRAFEEALKKKGRKDDPDIRFSLTEPVEQAGDLVALHNLTEDKLLKALQLGGFPMPSIAVTKASIPHTNFGDITLVFGRDTIDPQADRRNTVYSADAWTPTFPAVEYEADSKVVSRLSRKYYDLEKRFGRDVAYALYSWVNDTERQLQKTGGEEAAIRALRDDTDMMKAFLADTGANVPGPVEQETVKRLDDSTIRLYDAFLHGLGEDVIRGFQADKNASMEERRNWRRTWLNDHLAELEDAYRDYMRNAGLPLSEEEMENILQNTPMLQYNKWLNGIRQYLETGPETRETTIDTTATREAIRQAVDMDRYDQWLRDTFGGVEKSTGVYNGKDFYTANGDRRSFASTHFPVTLENIARAMASQNDGNTKHVTGFNGVKSLRAGMAERFGSVADMHGREGRLAHLTEAEAEAINDALSGRLTDILERLYSSKEHGRYENSFIEYDRLGEIMMGLTEKKITIDSIIRAYQRAGYKVGTPMAQEIKELLFDVAEMPVNIFEAKPERAVRFDEVLEAIVPAGTDQRVIDGLREQGVKVTEYAQGDDADRLAKVNAVEGARFSISEQADADYFSAAEGGKLGREGVPEGYDSLENFMKASNERAAQRRAERVQTQRKESFQGTEAMDKLGIRIEGSVGVYQFVESMKQADLATKAIKRSLRRAEQRLQATEGERAFAAGVAAGLYDEYDIPKTMNIDKVMELADYYMAEKSATGDRLAAQKEEIKDRLGEQMEDLFRDADKGYTQRGRTILDLAKGERHFDSETPRLLSLNYNTPERNMRMTFGDALGGRVNATVFDPVHINEAERIRFVNRMLGDVRKIQDKTGKKSELTKEESALVQMKLEDKLVGEFLQGVEMRSAIEEAAREINSGKSAKKATEKLSKQQAKWARQYAKLLRAEEALRTGKADAVKIDNAAKTYREKFNLFYDAVNDFLVAHGYAPIEFRKNYAPHMQSEEVQGALSRAFQRMGVNGDVTRLPSEIAGLTASYKPNKRWNPYFLQRTGDLASYDILSGFESYVEYMSDVLYHMDDIMRVRAMSDYFRRTYAKGEIGERIEQVKALQDYGDLNRMANFLRDQGVMDRTTVPTPQEIRDRMEEYVAKQYEAIGKTTKYSDLVMWLDNYANILAGKQSMIDRGLESFANRETLNIGNKINRAFARANVAGNLSSAINQTAQVPIIAAKLGAKWTAAAIRDISSGRLKGGWIGESDFLTGKMGTKSLSSTTGEKVLTAMFKLTEISDLLVSQIAVRGKYLQEINAGKDHAEAMKAADQFGREIMGDRTKGSKPVAFHSKNFLVQCANMFQIEALNSWEYIAKDLPRDFRVIEKQHGKDKAAAMLASVLVKMLVGAFLLNRVAEEVYGGSPAPFDVFGLTANFVASGEGLTTNKYLKTVVDNGWEKLTGERLFQSDPDKMKGEDFDWDAAWKDTAYNLSNDIPFVRNVSGIAGVGDQTMPMPNLGKTVPELTEAVKKHGVLSPETGKAALNLTAEVLPGGKQMKKTGLAIEYLIRGGDFSGYGDKEKLKYPADRDPFSVMQALMFGKYATKSSDTYFASGDSALTVNETRMWNAMVEGGVDAREAYEAIKEFRRKTDGLSSDYDESGKETVRKKDKVMDVIDAMEVEDEWKDALYYAAGYKESTIGEAPWHKGETVTDNRTPKAGNPTEEDFWAEVRRQLLENWGRK